MPDRKVAKHHGQHQAPQMPPGKYTFTQQQPGGCIEQIKIDTRPNPNPIHYHPRQGGGQHSGGKRHK